MSILASSSPDRLAAALAAEQFFPCSATVEAEYGDRVVPGTFLTLAHHGPRGGLPCPCLAPNVGPLPSAGRDDLSAKDRAALDAAAFQRRGTPAAVTRRSDRVVLSWHASIDEACQEIRRLDEAAGYVEQGGYNGPHMLGGLARPRVVGISHLDLDAVGGVLALQGRKPYGPAFWALAAHVDVHGPHRVADAGAPPEAVRAIHAYWAWSRRPEVRYSPPRDGAVEDVTARVDAAWAVLAVLLGECPECRGGREGGGECSCAGHYRELVAAGEAMQADEARLNAASFRGWVWVPDPAAGEESGSGALIAPTAGTAMRRLPVIVRESDVFVSSLYRAPSGEMAAAIVARNTKSGAITVSLERTIPGVSARAIVQALWGPDAGGHDGIAGSPRAGFAPADPEAELRRAAMAVSAAIPIALTPPAP